MVVYGLDRLCPGRLGDRDDPIVRNLTELAACRQRPYEGVWTPALNMPREAIGDAAGVDEDHLVHDDEESEVTALRPGA